MRHKVDLVIWVNQFMIVMTYDRQFLYSHKSRTACTLAKTKPRDAGWKGVQQLVQHMNGPDLCSTGEVAHVESPILRFPSRKWLLGLFWSQHTWVWFSLSFKKKNHFLDQTKSLDSAQHFVFITNIQISLTSRTWTDWHLPLVFWVGRCFLFGNWHWIILISSHW